MTAGLGFYIFILSQKRINFNNHRHFLNEEANNYHIIALGSLLGVSVNRGNFSFPVGKVQFMTLCPLDFEEHLMAMGEHGLIDLIRESYEKDAPLDSAFHERALDYYKEYLLTDTSPRILFVFLKRILALNTILSQYRFYATFCIV